MFMKIYEKVHIIRIKVNLEQVKVMEISVIF